MNILSRKSKIRNIGKEQHVNINERRKSKISVQLNLSNKNNV